MREQWLGLLSSILLIALVWAIYANTLHGPFVFDDFHVIPDNLAVHELGNIPGYFTDVSHFSVLAGNRDYRPVFLTSMALAWWAGNGATWPFHVVSITLHSANVVLLFLIARVLLRRETDLSESDRESRSNLIALGAAALFAVHPLAGESINYISAQSVPLTAFFYLSSFLAFLVVHIDRRSLTRWSRTALYAVAYVSFALALLSKAIAITLPLILLLCELLFGRPTLQLQGHSFRHRLGRMLKHLPFWMIGLAYIGVRGLVSNAALSAGGAPRSPVVHYMTETKALVFYYLKLFVAPFDQSVDRDFALVTSPWDTSFIIAVLILATASGVIFVFRRKRNFVFWTLWFPVCLSVTTYAVILGQVVNEHRVYLSLAGLCVLAAYLFSRLLLAFPLSASDFRIGPRSGLMLCGPLALIVILGLAQRTIARNDIWSSSLSLWEEAVRNRGTWRAHMNYGLALEEARRPDEALVQFENAVRLGPYAFAYLNLGNAQMRRGKHEEGLRNLRTAVRLWPTSPETRLFLALGLSRIDALEEAEAEFKKALELRPNYLRAQRHLAEFYQDQGRYDEARSVLQTLEALTPGQQWIATQMARLEQAGTGPDDSRVDRHFRAAFSNQKAGRLGAAINMYERLLASSPRHVQATFNVAHAYLQEGPTQDLTRSAELFDRVLELSPEYSEALFHLATANWKAGNTRVAAGQYREYLARGAHRDLRALAEARLSEIERGP